MPYRNGEVPEIGDHVKDRSERPGVITDLQLAQANLHGEDQVSVKWDDGGVGVGMMLAREFFFVSKGNPDTYYFRADCPICNAKRGVGCSRNQAKGATPIRVYAIMCGHHWNLTPEQSKKLINHLSQS